MKIVSSRRLLLVSLLLMCLLVVFAAGSVCAHPPSSMNLRYDATTKELEVNITHQVSDLSTHYVDTVVVKVNGVVNLSQNYTSQPASSFTYTYAGFEANENDTLEVTASCNLGGTISEQLVVGSEEVSETSGTPGFELIVFVMAILAVLILFGRRGR